MNISTKCKAFFRRNHYSEKVDIAWEPGTGNNESADNVAAADRGTTTNPFAQNVPLHGRLEDIKERLALLQTQLPDLKNKIV